MEEPHDYLTKITSKAEYNALIKGSAGKAILVAFSPEDSNSDLVVRTLQAQLPRSCFADYGIVDMYCFDVYSVPKLAAELKVTFVPTVMWYIDGVMDAIVWHEGVRVAGESVEQGVQRVVDRVKGGVMDVEMDSDEEWYAQGKSKQPNLDSDDGW